MSTYEVRVTTSAGDTVARFDVTEEDFKTTMNTLAVGDRVNRGIEVHQAREAAAEEADRLGDAPSEY